MLTRACAWYGPGLRTAGRVRRAHGCGRSKRYDCVRSVPYPRQRLNKFQRMKFNQRMKFKLCMLKEPTAVHGQSTLIHRRPTLHRGCMGGA